MRKNGIASRAFMVMVFLFLYAPIFLLIIFSFDEGNSNAVWQGFSLKWYQELFKDRIIMQSVYTTLTVSLIATVVSTVVGTFASIGFYNMRRRWREPLVTVNNIPMINADIVTGVALCLFFVAAFGAWNGFVEWMETTHRLTAPRLYMGFGSLLIAHICFDIPHVVLCIMPKLRQMDGHLIDAAQDLGCTWMQAFWKVVVPEIKPGIVNGLLIAFTMSVDDFVISYFTAGSTTANLAMRIYAMTKKRISPEVNAISTLLFATVLILLIVINLREASQEKAARKLRR